MIGQLFAQAAPPVPDIAPLVRRFVQGGLWAPPGSAVQLAMLLLGCLVLFAIVVCAVQRDSVRWLRGLVDIRRHFDQLAAGLEILRRNKRPFWIVLLAAVLSWTGWSPRVWQNRSQSAELEALLTASEMKAGAFAAAHALTQSLAPLRSLLSLADLLPMVLAAALVLFARTAEMSQHLRLALSATENLRLKRRLGTIWVGLIILAGYRVVVYFVDPLLAPLDGCLYIDSVALPLILLGADGLMLSWLLTEFGRAMRGHLGWESDDTAAFVRGLPSAVLLCGVTNPGRYLALIVAMLEHQWTQAATRPAPRWTPILWASAIAQMLGLVWFAFPGVLAVCRRGGVVHQLRTYHQLLRQAGGQVVGLTIVAILLSFLVTMPFYWVFGIMQPETWSLLGAASYGHYASLLLGLVLLAGVSQLAQQELGLDDPTRPVGMPLQSPTAALVEAE